MLVCVCVCVSGGVHTIAFLPLSPLASVRPALAAAVAASCVEASKKRKKKTRRTATERISLRPVPIR